MNHTYFNVAAGQVPHFCWVSLFNHADLVGSNNVNSEKYVEQWKHSGLKKSKKRANNLDRCPPAHNEGGVVLPAQAARIHVRPQVSVVPQHVGDPLLGAEVVDFNPLQTAL